MPPQRCLKYHPRLHQARFFAQKRRLLHSPVDGQAQSCRLQGGLSRGAWNFLQAEYPMANGEPIH